MRDESLALHEVRDGYDGRSTEACTPSREFLVAGFQYGVHHQLAWQVCLGQRQIGNMCGIAFLSVNTVSQRDELWRWSGIPGFREFWLAVGVEPSPSPLRKPLLEGMRENWGGEFCLWK